MPTLVVNGTERRFDGDPEMPLLWFLRDELGLTGTKFGCGQALCGACTVHVDGAAVRACQTPSRRSKGRRSRPSRAFRRTASTRSRSRGATSTSRNAATARPARSCRPRRFLKDTPNPTDDDIDTAMSGNLCRCGTYPRIRAAIKQAAAKGGKT